MSWKIDFYDAKVEKDIKSWPKTIIAKYNWISDLIEEFGPENVGMPHVRPLSKGLFEIRAKGVEGLGRAIFCMVKGKIVVVLNGFIKKSQKTPPVELALAKKRMQEVKND